ncbi:hypothetical protein ACQ4N7_24850 [Nodosilinea sp. AN01ver1]
MTTENQSEGRRSAVERNNELRASWARREAYWDTPESKERAKAAQERMRFPGDDE